MKSMVENRGRWDAGFRSPLLRWLILMVNDGLIMMDIASGYD